MILSIFYEEGIKGFDLRAVWIENLVGLWVEIKY